MLELEVNGLMMLILNKRRKFSEILILKQDEKRRT